MNRRRRAGLTGLAAICGIAIVAGCAEETVVMEASTVPPDRPGVRIERGAVQLGHLHLARHGEASTLIYNLSEEALVTASVLDSDGRPLGSSVVRHPAGPVVQTVRLARPAERVRVLVSAVPASGEATTTIDFTPGQNPQQRRIISPGSGKAIEADNVKLRVFVDDLELERPDRHLDVALDGGEHISIDRDTMTFKDLPPGPHTVTVWGADANHQPISEDAQVSFHNTGPLAVSPQKAIRRGHHLYPHPGMIAHSPEPILAWDEVEDASQYTITITEAESARQVHANVIRETRYPISPGVLTAERHYIWKVWPHDASGTRAKEPYGVSWFAIHPRGDGAGPGHGGSGVVPAGTGTAAAADAG